MSNIDFEFLSFVQFNNYPFTSVGEYFFHYWWDELTLDFNLKNYCRKQDSNLGPCKNLHENYWHMDDILQQSTWNLRKGNSRQVHQLQPLQLYKTLNFKIPSSDWMRGNFNLVNTTRQLKFAINRSNRLKMGMKVPSKRFWYLKGKIVLDWFNLTFESYKSRYKNLLL